MLKTHNERIAGFMEDALLGYSGEESRGSHQTRRANPHEASNWARCLAAAHRCARLLP